MNELKEELRKNLNSNLIQIVISNPREKSSARKIQVRPVELKCQLLFQFAVYDGKQVFHQNLDEAKACDQILEYMENYRQLELLADGLQFVILVSKKGKITINKKVRQDLKQNQNLSHNRTKKYILEEGKPLLFLQDLGVQTAEGKIVKSQYDKFRQINRFLEFIQDVANELPTDREAVIIDFGCGKSYLTFAMYYYLHEMRGMDIRIIGLDLKEDVIRHCNQLRTNYQFEKLDFFIGDIAQYEGVSKVDMVVTLHACDTATDYALAKAVKWGASVILSVPCCQHELNQQIECKELESILKYGLLKERVSALFTDGIRGNLLEQCGYQVQLLEFIDMEHTPKNILIRAVKKAKEKDVLTSIDGLEGFLNGKLTLSKLLKGEIIDET